MQENLNNVDEFEDDDRPFERHQLVFSVEDSIRFLHSLDNPKPPNAAFLKAKAAYEKEFGVSF